MELQHWFAMGSLGIVVNIILIIFLIFFERKSPSTTWAWLLILIFIPIIGFILYLLFGLNLNRQKLSNKKLIDDTTKNNYFKNLKEKHICNPSSIKNQDVIFMNYNNCNAVYTEENKVTLLADGIELFNDIKENLSNAKEYIHIEFYIFRSDKIGTELLDILCKKSKEGIGVKLLIDDMGNGIKRKDVKRLKNSGVKYSVFFPSVLHFLNLRLNYRNHRKIIVIDGSISYVGGFNVGDEYLGDSKIGNWRDTHLKIEGPAINDLEERFLLDWTYSVGEELTDEHKKYMFKHTNYIDNEEITPLQIISSGPDHRQAHIKNVYMKIINNAKKNIYIQSPYFVPDDSILDSLKLSALSGVNVNIMLPGKPDHFFMPWVSNQYIDELLESNVNVYFYNNGFIHAKTIVSDSSISSVGTANMDIRSFTLNFETNAILYGEKIALELERQFKDDLNHCEKLDLKSFKKRSIITKFFEAIFRLISPIM
ncbi:cardiolipin synthase [uncultured Clostridium sp.]|jgi:cardiolipin synthase|uniref:cardiolipin synthase n=1 Tax=uncultured Clostridium sp. TaxID=59620 RepID=UPI002604EB39|nr:cardiolipin synthase [uncultured Clostridium sp.]